MQSEILKKYKQKLKDNPSFQYGTVVRYMKAIDELLLYYGDNPSIEQINHFITKKCRKHQPYVKYAIKEFFDLIGRMEEYHKLVKAVCRRPMKQKTFLDVHGLQSIIGFIKHPLHKTLAIIQSSTGLRASEVIQIRKKLIYIENDKIRFHIIGKGDKPHKVFLNLEIWNKYVKEYYDREQDYIFLGIIKKDHTDKDIYKKTYTLYKRYDESLKWASFKALGFNITTHDLRRSAANLIDDPRKAQKVLNHSSMDVTEIYLKDDPKQIAETLLELQQKIWH